MRILIVEDEFTSRAILLKFLSSYGVCEVAVNGKEALSAVENAITENEPYDLICLDIMMPELDGREVLKTIRDSENKRNIWGQDAVKVIMTSGKSDPKSIIGSFKDGCEAYLYKPIDKQKLINHLSELGLISA
jgi:two-component system chemotaxis response regulator CheY